MQGPSSTSVRELDPTPVAKIPLRELRPVQSSKYHYLGFKEKTKTKTKNWIRKSKGIMVVRFRVTVVGSIAIRFWWGSEK